MPGATLPPDHIGQVGRAVARVERIERVTRSGSPTPPIWMSFSYPGQLTGNIESPPWYPPRAGKIELIRVSLLATATTTHTVQINVNGAAITQISLSAGSKTTAATPGAGIGLDQGDYLSIYTVSVTDSNMTVDVRLT